MIPLPRMSFTGVLDYLALAAGLAVGFAIFKPPMDSLENAFRRKGGVKNGRCTILQNPR